MRRHDDGWTHVEVQLRVPTELADPPRVGTEGVLPAGLEVLEWFGDGPHECYPDRRAGATLARWTARVDDQYEDLVLPQEHGHRTGVRWFTLRPVRTSRQLPGLLVVADAGVRDGTIGMAVRRHSDAELWASRHSDELATLAARRPPATYLYLDVAQRGLGTGSCGPDTLEQYRIPAGRHRLAFWCTTLARGDDPGELARSVRGPR
jgi:beta-galactosidase